MSEKKSTFVSNMTPFIRNMNGRNSLPAKDIDVNGLQRTDGFDMVDVNVEEAGELSPEAQDEILTAEY